MSTKLSILFIDDDKDYLDLIPRTIGNELDGMELLWETCLTFQEGLDKLSKSRYDAVISDLYEGTKPDTIDVAGLSIVERIRDKQFCPILLVSARKKPDQLKLTAFVEFAEKTVDEEVEEAVRRILKQLPKLVRKLHDEIDSHGRSYLWQHLDKEWDRLKGLVGVDSELLERLIRRRMAVQISRLIDTAGVEIETVKGLEFYLYPPISGDELRLGDVLKYKKDPNDFRVILTPHCQLKVQPAETTPRAEFVLTVKAVDALKILAANTKRNKFPKENASVEEAGDFYRRRINPIAEVGKPAGRFWFLPGFLDIPDLYCDFLQVESFELKDIAKDYDRIATLDTPFAESLQANFAGFYSSVGIPNLVGKDFLHLRKAIDLIPEDPPVQASAKPEKPSKNAATPGTQAIKKPASDAKPKESKPAEIVAEKSQESKPTAAETVAEKSQESKPTAETVAEKSQESKPAAETVAEKSQESKPTAAETVAEKSQESKPTAETVAEKSQESKPAAETVAEKSQESKPAAETVAEKSQESKPAAETVAEKSQESKPAAESNDEKKA